MPTTNEKLDQLIAHQISQNEYNQLGHRIVFDIITGQSRNIFGIYCNPKLLDSNGYQISYE